MRNSYYRIPKLNLYHQSHRSINFLNIISQMLFSGLLKTRFGDIWYLHSSSRRMGRTKIGTESLGYEPNPWLLEPRTTTQTTVPRRRPTHIGVDVEPWGWNLERLQPFGFSWKIINYEVDIQLLFLEVNKLFIVKSIRIFITRYKNISITFSLFSSKYLALFTKGAIPLTL